MRPDPSDTTAVLETPEIAFAIGLYRGHWAQSHTERPVWLDSYAAGPGGTTLQDALTVALHRHSEVRITYIPDAGAVAASVRHDTSRPELLMPIDHAPAFPRRWRFPASVSVIAPTPRDARAIVEVVEFDRRLEPVTLAVDTSRPSARGFDVGEGWGS
jgi:hypothetical protein